MAPRKTVAERVASLVRERLGQSSAEYAIVLGAFLAMVVALGAFWAMAAEGGLQRLAARAASHVVVGEGAIGGMRDIVLF